ncbi:pyocin knob domain-containing S74 family peptidase [Oscillochloris sp. ZM17-4]|uniref:pyocin knob domain-containing S74 family peptidase n=1 Tax=Oscillochloris sp. ZM17-4 TaxID=2866714 RepID=UPI001C73669B|nr:pyocin knob domain-containing S74 family peptidase [Oscillochloris sp. ZM17-4]MBX0328676.1 pyocin knob domain-containing S74 family peptidase [Oscillochloris sp. ZM17-4]
MDFRSQLTQNGVPVALLGHTHAFGDLTGKPTTLAGYGITDALSTAGGSAGRSVFLPGTDSAMAAAVGSLGQLEARSSGAAGAGAFIAFHRPGTYAAYLGLDTDNKFKVGGWSMGAVAYELWHDGNAAAKVPDDATLLGGSQDLNSYQTAGFYYQNSNANAGSGSNYPQAYAGSLLVQKSAGVTQLYATYYTAAPELWFRTYYAGSWTAWRRVLTSVNYSSYAPSLTGGGASGTWDIDILGNAATSTATTQSTWSDLYVNGWFRNNAALTGIYNQNLGVHLYAHSTVGWTITSNGGYPQLAFRTGHQGTMRGYVYSDATGFGLLHSGGGWMLYANGNANVTFPGQVISQTYMTITQNANAGYQFYERDQNVLWVLYSQSGIARLWRGSDLFNFGSAGNMGIRQALWSGCALSVKGMGTSSSTYGMILYDSAGGNTFWVRDDGVGWLKVNPLTYSDARRKTQIADIDNPLALISALRPRSFVMRDDPSEKRRYGLIAQEAIAIIPDLVDLSVQPGQNEAEYSMDYIGLIGPLIGAVQQLAARVTTLEETPCSR